MLPLPSESRISYDAKLIAIEMKKLHEQVKNHIEKTNVAYKARANKHRKKMKFSPRDLVWLHLKKERFPSTKKNKLISRGDVPFKIIPFKII